MSAPNSIQYRLPVLLVVNTVWVSHCIVDQLEFTVISITVIKSFTYLLVVLVLTGSFAKVED